MSTTTTNHAQRKRSRRFGLKSLLVAMVAVALLIRSIQFLDPRIQIQGQVVFADSGQPVADVRVHAQPVDRSRVRKRAFIDRVQTALTESWFGKGPNYHREGDSLTDKDGRFVLAGLQKGKYNVFVDAGDGWVAPAIESFDATRRKTQVDTIHLVKGAVIKGQLVDSKTGKIVAVGNRKVRIGMHGPSRPRSGAAIDSALVMPDGTFEIRVVPGKNVLYLTTEGGFKSEGPFQLTPSQAGYLIEADEAEEVVSLDFEVSPSLPAEPPLRMEP